MDKRKGVRGFFNFFWKKSEDEIRAEERFSSKEERGEFVIESLAYLIKAQRRELRARWIKRFLVVAVIFGPMAFIWMPDLGYLAAGSEKVAIISVDGVIGERDASPSVINTSLNRAFDNPKVKAIVLSIDSPGGHPQDAERIYTVIERGRQETGKPVYAVVNRMGASAAYMISIHADKIIAGKYSLVGSIGAILSGWNASQILDNFGLEYRTYASGKYKSILNPFVAMTDEANGKAQSLVNQMAKVFQNDVLERRGVKLKKEVDYFTGEVWQGSDAIEMGLIDELGTLDEFIRKEFGTDITVVAYKGPNYSKVTMEYWADSFVEFFALVKAKIQSIQQM